MTPLLRSALMALVLAGALGLLVELLLLDHFESPWQVSPLVLLAVAFIAGVAVWVRPGRRMRHEFEEYRPYKSMEQFRREIGKYVNKEELARLERYVMIR